MTTHTLSGEALGGLTAGKLNEHDLLIMGDAGIEGLGVPGRRTSLADRYGDGAIGGAQFLNVREIAATLATDSLTTLQQLQAAMTARPNPLDEVPLTMEGLGFTGQRRVWVRPERFEYRVDQTATAASFWRIDAAWLATDTTIYGEEQTSHVFGTGSATDGMATTPQAYFDVPVTNAGLRAVSSGRALELRIVADGGAITNPYIKVQGDADRSDEEITWYMTMTSGQVLTTDDALVARVGSSLAGGYAKTGASPYTKMPRANPGLQTIRIGCATGAISGYLKVRDTW